MTQVEVELPETLVEREVEFMITQTAMQLQNQGIDIKRLLNQETLPMLKERSRPDAIERIKRTLALGEVAKRESLTTSESEVNDKVREVMADLEGREVDSDRLRSAVAEDLLKEKILSWLEEHNTIELVPEGTLKKEEEFLEDDLIEEESFEDSLTEVDADDAIEVEATSIETE